MEGSSVIHTIKPTRVLKAFRREVGVKIYGRQTSLVLKDFTNKSVLAHWGEVAQEIGATRILAPIPSKFNARIWDGQTTSADAQWFSLPHRAKIFRPGYFDGVVLKKKSDSFLLFAAGCAVLIMRVTVTSDGMQKRKTFVAHAGRDSLGAFRDIQAGKDRLEFRTPGSVVEAMVDQVRREGGDLSRAEAYICCAIGPKHFNHPFSHPEFGKQNQLMIDYIIESWGRECIEGEREEGCISLKMLIRRQLIAAGVSEDLIDEDDVDTHGDLDQKGEPLYHSTRRAGDDKTGRTSIFVYHQQ